MFKNSNKFIPNVYNFIEDFYIWMENQDYFHIFFNTNEHLNKVKESQITYWHEFFECNINFAYIEKRFRVGKLHAKIDLPVEYYCLAMSKAQNWWINFIINSEEFDLHTQIKIITIFNKLLMLELSLVSSAYSEEINEIRSKLSKKSNLLENLNNKLNKLNNIDPLTKAFNRRYLYTVLNEKMKKVSLNNEYTFALLMLDVDNFKTIT